MSPIVERLAVLREQLGHLRAIRGRVRTADDLRDLSLRNDVLYALLSACQVVIDVAAELSARRAEAFEDYTAAVRNLGRDPRFPKELVEELASLPGFRNVLVHEYVTIDLERVVRALDRLDVLDRFLRIAAEVAAE